MWNGIFNFLFVLVFIFYCSYAQSDNRTFNAQHFTLTFDDGPHPETTPIVLQQLKEKNVTNAIFFLIGDRIAQYPELVKKIQSYQYIIGYHSMHHKNQATMTAAEIHQDIQSFKKVLNQALETTYDLKYARPPFGGMTPKTVKIFKTLETAGALKQQSLDSVFNQRLVAKQIQETYHANGLQTLLWNVDFKDWEQRLDLEHARQEFIPHLHQVWLFHEMPTYKGAIFNNQLTQDLPQFLNFLCEYYC